MAGEILMPALSPTMTAGRLARWLVAEGAQIRAGDVIAEIETDKATMEVEAAESGILEKILVPEGTDDVAVNAPIARLAGGAAAVPAATAAPMPAATAQATAQATAEVPAPAPAPARQPASPTIPPSTSTPTPASQPRLAASPLARRLAREYGIDLAGLQGSGPAGRILRRDVDAARRRPPPAAPAEPSAPAPVASRGGTRLPLNAVRRISARRLLEAKQTIPHFYVSMDFAMERLMDLRARLNARAPKDGDGAYRLSVNDLIIKATAAALRQVGDVNVSFAGDAILRHEHVDIAVAVAIPGGLITPVLRDADRMGLIEISRSAASLAAKARAGKLMPEEYQGGTFSISNLGMFGVTSFSAIINPPQAAILAVSAVEERAVVRGGAVVPGQVMSVTLSVDHRAVDGALAAEFLRTLRGIIEEPYALLL